MDAIELQAAMFFRRTELARKKIEIIDEMNRLDASIASLSGVKIEQNGPGAFVINDTETDAAVSTNMKTYSCAYGAAPVTEENKSASAKKPRAKKRTR